MPRPVISQFACCMSSMANQTFRGRGEPSRPWVVGDVMTCTRCTRVWEKFRGVVPDERVSDRWRLVDEPEPEVHPEPLGSTDPRAATRPPYCCRRIIQITGPLEVGDDVGCTCGAVYLMTTRGLTQTHPPRPGQIVRERSF
jgi:hypothetical protein